MSQRRGALISGGLGLRGGAEHVGAESERSRAALPITWAAYRANVQRLQIVAMIVGACTLATVCARHERSSKTSKLPCPHSTPNSLMRFRLRTREWASRAATMAANLSVVIRTKARTAIWAGSLVWRNAQAPHLCSPRVGRIENIENGQPESIGQGWRDLFFHSDSPGFVLGDGGLVAANAPRKFCLGQPDLDAGGLEVGSRLHVPNMRPAPICVKHRRAGAFFQAMRGANIPRMDTTMALGQAIRRLRKRLGKTQDEISEAAGLGQSGLSKVERGMQGVSTETLVGIARGLGIPVSAIWAEAEVAGSLGDAVPNKRRVQPSLADEVKAVSSMLTIMVGVFAAKRPSEGKAVADAIRDDSPEQMLKLKSVAETLKVLDKFAQKSARRPNPKSG